MHGKAFFCLTQAISYLTFFSRPDWLPLGLRGGEDVDIWQQNSFLFLNQIKFLKNSTPGNIVGIWHIEQLQIDAIKFERMQIHFFTDVFTAVIVVLA